MTNSNAKGSRRERQLCTELYDRGWAVLRAPSSGSATDREAPDVLAGNGTRSVAIEAKASSGQPIYIDASEIADLQHFAEAFGADAVVGARFDRMDWAFFDPGYLYRTDAGTYRVKKQTAKQGRGFEAL